MRVAVVGATGTIGRPLVGAPRSGPRRRRRGAATARRSTDGCAGSRPTRRIRPRSEAALEGVEVVYHLVHSLGSADFEAARPERPRGRRRRGGGRRRVAGRLPRRARGGIRRASRRISAAAPRRREILARGPVPVTTLRAAMIVGPGSAAFETILALVERLPVMVCPRWVSVETQPVALADVLRALVGSVRRAGDVRGDLRSRRPRGDDLPDDDGADCARLRGKHPLLIEVPFLTPRLSSLWLHLVTPAKRVGRTPARRGAADPDRRAGRPHLGARRGSRGRRSTTAVAGGAPRPRLA